MRGRAARAGRARASSSDGDGRRGPTLPTSRRLDRTTRTDVKPNAFPFRGTADRGTRGHRPRLQYITSVESSLSTKTLRHYPVGVPAALANPRLISRHASGVAKTAKLQSPPLQGGECLRLPIS